MRANMTAKAVLPCRQRHHLSWCQCGKAWYKQHTVVVIMRASDVCMYVCVHAADEGMKAVLQKHAVPHSKKREPDNALHKNHLEGLGAVSLGSLPKHKGVDVVEVPQWVAPFDNAEISSAGSLGFQ